MSGSSTHLLEQSKRVPTVGHSERMMKKDVEKALEVLKERNATDLIDALGLRPYVKE